MKYIPKSKRTKIELCEHCKINPATEHIAHISGKILHLCKDCRASLKAGKWFIGAAFDKERDWP